MAAEWLQLPRHFIDSAQHVQVVAAESAPQTFASVQPALVVPRGSSALAMRVRSELLVSDIRSHQKQSSVLSSYNSVAGPHVQNTAGSFTSRV